MRCHGRSLFVFGKPIIITPYVGAAGVADYFEIARTERNGLQKVYEFAMTSALSLAVQDEYIYTKIITISPRYTFHNFSEMTLEVVQEGCFESPVVIEPGESESFHWPNAQRPRQVLLKLGKGCEAQGVKLGELLEWDWSNPFSLEELGAITVKCRHQTRGCNYIVLKVNKVRTEGAAIRVEVEKERDEYPAYRIENYSRHFSLSYWQKGKELDKDYLDVLSQAMLGWADNSLPRVLQIKFLYGPLDLRPIDVREDKVFDFSLDELDQRREIKVKLTEKTGHLLYVSTLTDGYTKILKITDVQSAYDMSSRDEECKYKYLLQVLCSAATHFDRCRSWASP